MVILLTVTNDTGKQHRHGDGHDHRDDSFLALDSVSCKQRVSPKTPEWPQLVGNQRRTQKVGNGVPCTSDGEVGEG